MLSQDVTKRVIKQKTGDSLMLSREVIKRVIKQDRRFANVVMRGH